MIVKTNNILIISVFTLVLTCFLFAVCFYKSEESFKKLKKKSAVENQLKQNHLDEILHKYDSVSVLSKSLYASDTAGYVSLVEQKVENIFFDSLNFKSLDKQLELLDFSIKRNKSKVGFLNKKIATDEAVFEKLNSLKHPNINRRANKLSVLNITTRGVKILPEKFSDSNIKKIQELRICFTIEANEFVKKGDKQFYIQVVNPKNKIMSIDETFVELKDVKLIYSAKVDASYSQKDIDVCAYVGLEKDKTIKGSYKINIYNDFSKIGTTIFEYN